MLNKRLKIVHVYDIPQKLAKRDSVDFLENCICGDKNISDFDYGGETFHTHILMSLVKFSWRLVLFITRFFPILNVIRHRGTLPMQY